MGLRKKKTLKKRQKNIKKESSKHMGITHKTKRSKHNKLSYPKIDFL